MQHTNNVFSSLEDTQKRQLCVHFKPLLFLLHPDQCENSKAAEWSAVKQRGRAFCPKYMSKYAKYWVHPFTGLDSILDRVFFTPRLNGFNREDLNQLISASVNRSTFIVSRGKLADTASRSDALISTYRLGSHNYLTWCISVGLPFKHSCKMCCKIKKKKCGHNLTRLSNGNVIADSRNVWKYYLLSECDNYSPHVVGT